MKSRSDQRPSHRLITFVGVTMVVLLVGCTADPPRPTPGDIDEAIEDVEAGAAAPYSEGLGDPTEPQRYVVQPGDSFASIANEFYGDATRFNEILEANEDRLPLDVGEVIVIP